MQYADDKKGSKYQQMLCDQRIGDLPLSGGANLNWFDDELPKQCNDGDLDEYREVKDSVLDVCDFCGD